MADNNWKAMNQDDIWLNHYKEIMDYLLTFKRRPSKHRIEDHQMLNWIKYNKKLMAREKMDESRIPYFKQLLEVAEKYRKLNQSAYANKNSITEPFLF